MNFDNEIIAPCLVGSTSVNTETCGATGGGSGGTGTGGGGDPTGTGGGVEPPVPPSTDERCEDPAFYDANPAICSGYPRLILKPSSSIVEVGQTTRYRTFLRTVESEIELTNGLNYSVTGDVAVIEPYGGVATGQIIGTGQVAVQWQNKHAYATIEVVASCADVHTNYVLLVDNSKSMGQSFSGAFATKLAFARITARAFVQSVNYNKDSVGVAQFNDAGTIIQELTEDMATAVAAVNSIAQSTGKSDLLDGVQTVIDYLAGKSGKKVIIVFSDGENTGTTPLPLAQAFKDAGGVIVSVALRSWGQYFDLMYKLGSAGFFLSAYEDTQDSVQSTIIGLKGYMCSGECHPPAGTHAVAQLDYRGFINWDVSGLTSPGSVDLCGLGVFDVWPGNGMYVDMSGTPESGVYDTNILTSKEAFTLVEGNSYRFTISIAGNHRGRTENAPVTVQIGSWSRVYTPTDKDMDFTVFVEDFEAEASGEFNIIISQPPAQTGPAANTRGTFIDEITFESVTDNEVLLYDNFDEENIQTIPAGGGEYSYYGGCLVTPPGAQTADPTPPPTLVE